MTDELHEGLSEIDKASFAKSLRAVVDAFAKLRFGAIQMTVHEGRLVQIDVTKRQRFT